MFRIDLVVLRPMLTFVLPDTVHTLGSHRVYIRRIHQLKHLKCLVNCIPVKEIKFLFLLYLTFLFTRFNNIDPGFSLE